MPLSPDERQRIRKRYQQLVEQDPSISMREIGRRLSPEFGGVSGNTIQYWADPRIRAREIQRSAQVRNTPENVERQKVYHKSRYSNEDVRERQKFYSKLRRSHLTREILPRIFSQSGKEIFDFQELSDLIRRETNIEFQEKTLKTLLVDKYSGSARGPLIIENHEQGQYRINPNFYS